MDQADIDILLVGDSASMVIHGHDTTLPITLEEMLVHCRSVSRGAKKAFLVGDIPFGSYESDDEHLLKAAIRDNDPVVFLESEKMYGDKGVVPEGEFMIPIGVANVTKKGTDVTIVSFGKILKVVAEAVEVLEKEGVSCEVIDLRTVRPIDYPTVVESIKKTNRCVVVEESWPLASIASEMAYHLQRYAFDYLDAPVMRVMQTDTPLAFSPTLIPVALPSTDRVVKAVRSVMYR